MPTAALPPPPRAPLVALQGQGYLVALWQQLQGSLLATTFPGGRKKPPVPAPLQTTPLCHPTADDVRPLILSLGHPHRSQRAPICVLSAWQTIQSSDSAWLLLFPAYSAESLPASSSNPTSSSLLGHLHGCTLLRFQRHTGLPCSCKHLPPGTGEGTRGRFLDRPSSPAQHILATDQRVQSHQYSVLASSLSNQGTLLQMIISFGIT